MALSLRFAGLAALFLAACQAADGPLAAAGPAERSLAAEAVTQRPEEAPGACWRRAVLPARFETVTERIVENGAAAGAAERPATVRSETRQSMIEDRRKVWFAVPCPEVFTPAFVATLQRALKARGLYAEPVTGALDAATGAAVRRYQAVRGLDSDVLSLAAAREMGIVAADLSAP